ncbi:MAG: response regulator transcription factor [Pseudonocardiaceae bacterium]
MRILLVDDDDEIAGPLTTGLCRQGFEVSRATNGTQALAAKEADLVLLDLGLPDLDGLEVCRRLREHSTVPIIVISARSEELERVLSLDLGADDYVVKPFGFRELVARIRAVVRRVHVTPAKDGPQTVGDLAIDRRTRKVTLAGREVTLTLKEFDLLALLADDPGAVRTREDIIEQVWDSHWFGSTRTLDVHVASLRAKLDDPALVETIRGVGYRLRIAS